MSEQDLANLNLQIACDELEDACIALKEALNKMAESFRELRGYIEDG